MANVAATILNQIGGNKFLVMTGAKNLMADENALTMRLPGTMTHNRINYLKITLDPSDTYTMEFGKIRGLNYTVIETAEDIYCDMLRDVFESTTGLLTSMGTMAG